MYGSFGPLWQINMGHSKILWAINKTGRNVKAHNYIFFGIKKVLQNEAFRKWLGRSGCVIIVSSNKTLDYIIFHITAGKQTNFVGDLHTERTELCVEN